MAIVRESLACKPYSSDKTVRNCGYAKEAVIAPGWLWRPAATITCWRKLRIFSVICDSFRPQTTPGCWEAPGRAPALKEKALASYVSALIGGCHSIVTETLFDGVVEQALCTIAVHVPEASSPPSEALI
jgi:hypothetical protein